MDVSIDFIKLQLFKVKAVLLIMWWEKIKNVMVTDSEEEQMVMN